MREIPAPPSIATALFLQTATGGGAVRNSQLSLSFGESVPSPLARATLDKVVEANPLLRGGFFRTTGSDFVLRDGEAHEVRWQTLDWTKNEPSQIPELWKMYLTEDAARPFSLENSPLLRAACFELPGGNTHYLLTFPSFLLDDQSLYRLLLQWLATIDGQSPAYENFPEAPAETAVDPAWKSTLSNLPAPLAIRPSLSASPAAAESEPLSSLFTRERSRKLRELAEILDVNVQSVFLAAQVLLLGRLAGEPDVLTLATPAGDSNLLPIRVRLDREQKVSDLIRAVHRASATAGERGTTGLGAIFSSLEKAPSLQDFGAAFVWAPPVLADMVHDTVPRWINLDAKLMRRWAFPLTIEIRDAGRFLVEFHFDATALAPSVVEELFKRYDHLLDAIEADPEVRAKNVSLLLDGETTPSAPSEEKPKDIASKRIEERFLETASRSGGDIAVQGDDESAALSYSELQSYANSLAWYLRQENLADGWVVAICLTTTPWLPVALLGVPLAGDTCMPLDPAGSPAWLAAQAASCDSELIIVDSQTAPLFEGVTRRLLVIDQQWDTISAAPFSDAPTKPPQNAFLLSGTETDPAPSDKTLNSARLAHAVKEAATRSHLKSGARLLLSAGAGTAGFLETIFSVLTSGATLLLPSPESSLLAQASSASHLRLTFDQWRQLLLDLSHEGTTWPESLRLVTVHADLPSPALFAKWQSLIGESVATQFFWSPLDLAGLSIRSSIRGDESLASVPLGFPTSGLKVSLLDACGEALPPHYVGKLHVSLVDDESSHWTLPAWRDTEGAFHLEASAPEEDLRNNPIVLDAIVHSVSSNDRLVNGLWVVAGGFPAELSEDIWESLTSHLPAAQRPAFRFPIPALPLSSAGMIDLAKLPRPVVPVPLPKPEPTASTPTPTVKVATAVAAPTAAWEPLVALSPEPTAPILLLVHDLEGEPSKYAPLTALLKDDWSIYATTARGTVQPAACHRSIEAEAAPLVEALCALDPVGPYYLLGYRFGATLAFEMARQLRVAGRSVDYLALVGGDAPALEPAKTWLTAVTGLFTAASKASPGSGSPVVDSHVQALRVYKTKPMEGPAGIILGADQGKEIENAWLECAPDGFVERMSSPSGQILIEPAVKRLAVILSEWTEESDEEESEE